MVELRVRRRDSCAKQPGEEATQVDRGPRPVLLCEDRCCIGHVDGRRFFCRTASPGPPTAADLVEGSELVREFAVLFTKLLQHCSARGIDGGASTAARDVWTVRRCRANILQRSRELQYIRYRAPRQIGQMVESDLI